MTGKMYKALMVDGEKVLCIDTTDGFILEIGGSRYHVYDEDDGTYIDMLIDDNEREYFGYIHIGKIDEGTVNEEKAARFIISLL